VLACERTHNNDARRLIESLKGEYDAREALVFEYHLDPLRPLSCTRRSIDIIEVPEWARGIPRLKLHVEAKARARMRELSGECFFTHENDYDALVTGLEKAIVCEGVVGVNLSVENASVHLVNAHGAHISSARTVWASGCALSIGRADTVHFERSSVRLTYARQVEAIDADVTISQRYSFAGLEPVELVTVEGGRVMLVDCQVNALVVKGGHVDLEGARVHYLSKGPRASVSVDDASDLLEYVAG